MIDTNNSSVLVVFCKRPKAGVGKQRIAAQLGESAALEVSSLLLDAALEDAAAWPGRVVIAPADAADAAWAGSLLPGAEVVPQEGTNLGDRINHVDAAVRETGGETVLVIGSDAPGLNAAVVEAARHALDTHDVVLVPATDGGVILLGCRTPWPRLGNLPWETDRLGAALERRCREAGLSVALLEPGHDIDYWEDLLTARGSLVADERPARTALTEWIDRRSAISIVVPVRDDTAALRELLTRVTPRLQSHDEVIVVDARQSADCRSACEHFGAIYQSQAGHRGERLNAGARVARNPILWFLHADAEPHPAATDKIRRTVAWAGKRHTVGGFFRFRFSGPRTWVKRLLEAAINFRTRTGTPYGDQGLFMSSEAFQAAGGFASTPLFEEVELVKRLRRAGRMRRLSVPIGVSPRRWEQDGWLRRTVHNRLLALGYALGVQPGRLAHLYRREPAAGNR